jgi:iron complex transport system substrate-binding protein
MKVLQIKLRRLLALFFVALLFLSLQIPATAGELPKRIISLAPNITEILFAMDLGDKIAGDTVYCDFPESAKKKPRVGGMSDPSLEAVVSLKPDMVIMTTDGNPPEFQDRLKALKIRTYVFRARKLSELPQGIRDMGLALGTKEKADALADKIEIVLNKYKVAGLRSGESKNARAKDSVPATVDKRFAAKKKVLFIIWPEPLIVAGSGTAIDEAITLLGYENIASRAKVSYPKYSIEEILYNPPDIIFIGKGHTDMKAMSKDLLRKLALVPAVKNGKVFFLSDNLYRLGPRVVQGIGEIAGCLN